MQKIPASLRGFFLSIQMIDLRCKIWRFMTCLAADRFEEPSLICELRSTISDRMADVMMSDG
jgi:hypothetical protein